MTSVEDVRKIRPGWAVIDRPDKLIHPGPPGASMVLGTWSELDKYLLNEMASELAFPAWIPKYTSLGHETSGEELHRTYE